MTHASYQTVGSLALKRTYERGPRLAYSAQRKPESEGRKARTLVLAVLSCLAFIFVTAFVVETLVRLPQATQMASLSYETHCVESGESLWSIAQSCDLESMRTEEVVSLIRSHNGLDSALLAPGQRLEIPVGACDGADRS